MRHRGREQRPRCYHSRVMSTVTAPASTPAPAAPPRTFKEVWLISAGHGFTHWYTGTFYILLPVIGLQLGLSYTEIGVIMSVQHLVGALVNIPGGMFVDNYGRKGYLMAVSLLWVGLPYALMSFSTSFWWLLVCVSMVGIGNNLWHPAAIPTLAHRFPDNKGRVLSFHGMGGNLGEAFAPLVVGSLLAVFSWQTVVWINVVPGMLMSLAILVGLGAFAVGGGVNAKGAKRSTQEYLHEFRQLLRNRSVMLIAVSSGFRSATQNGLLIFLPVYLAYELKYQPAAIGVVMMVLQVAGFAAGPIGGELSDRLGRKRVVMSSMVMTAVVIMAMVFAGNTPWFVFSVALLGFFLYATRPALHAWAMEAAPASMGGGTVGLQFAASHLGSAVSPLAFGLIADRFSVFAGFYFLVGTIIAANLLVCFLPGGNKPAPAAAH